MFDTRNAADRGDELAPATALRRQDLFARGGQAVIAPPPLARLLDPAPLDPAALLQAVEQRVERGDVEAQDAPRAPLDQVADVVAVPRLLFDQRENEQLGAPLLQLAVEHVRPLIWHSHILLRD